MNDFQTALTFVTKQVYQPNGLTVSNILEEKQKCKIRSRYVPTLVKKRAFQSCS